MWMPKYRQISKLLSGHSIIYLVETFEFSAEIVLFALVNTSLCPRCVNSDTQC